MKLYITDISHETGPKRFFDTELIEKDIDEIKTLPEFDGFFIVEHGALGMLIHPTIFRSVKSHGYRSTWLEFVSHKLDEDFDDIHYEISYKVDLLKAETIRLSFNINSKNAKEIPLVDYIVEEKQYAFDKPDPDTIMPGDLVRFHIEGNDGVLETYGIIDTMSRDTIQICAVNEQYLKSTYPTREIGVVTKAVLNANTLNGRHVKSFWIERLHRLEI